MPPYTKRSDPNVLDDGWKIEDGSGSVIAYLDTEMMADGMMALLTGAVAKDCSYPAGVAFGDDGRDPEENE